MPLQRDDYLTILRLLQSKLREADPEALDLVNRAAGLREPRLCARRTTQVCSASVLRSTNQSHVRTLRGRERSHIESRESLHPH